MSNIAGKAYAMNAVTPMRRYTAWWNRLFFWIAHKRPATTAGLNLFWFGSIKYPRSVPMLPFHRYITSNQVWTDYYYNAYPMASSNDIKSAKRVRQSLLAFIGDSQNANPAEFLQKYNRLLI